MRIKKVENIQKKFSKLPWAIIFAEEYARETRSELLREIGKMLRRPGFTTVTVPKRLENYTIASTERVFYYEGIGILREFTVISPTTEFSVEVASNKGEIISGTYTQLHSDSMALDFLVAIPKNSNYMVKVSNIGYDKWIKAVINVDSPVKFTEIRVLNDVIVRK